MISLRIRARCAAAGAAVCLLFAASHVRAMDGMSTRNFNVISAGTIDDGHAQAVVSYDGVWSNRFLDPPTSHISDRYQSLALRLTASPVGNLEIGGTAGFSSRSYYAAGGGYPPGYPGAPAYEGSSNGMFDPALGAKWRLLDTENVDVALVTSFRFPLSSKHSAFGGEGGVVLSIDGKNHFGADFELAEGGSSASQGRNTGAKRFVRVDLALGYQPSDRIRLFLEESFYDARTVTFSWHGLVGPFDKQRYCNVGPNLAWRLNENATLKTGFQVVLPGISKNVPLYVGNMTAIEFTI